MNIKKVAINLISQVDRGAYSNIALNETFKTLNVNSKEKAFITEIFYGVIRNKKIFGLYNRKKHQRNKKRMDKKSFKNFYLSNHIYG